MENALFQATVAGFATLLLFVAIFLLKGAAKVTKTISEKKQAFTDSQNHIAELVKSVTFDYLPKQGRIEEICFYLEEENESLFYNLSPNQVTSFRRRLEKLIKQIEQQYKSDDCYGFGFAIRKFYIGDQMVFQWQQEVKI